MPTPMHLPWQVRKGWQEAKHPRQPTGEHGGEFTSGGATGAATAPVSRPNPALDEFMAQTPTPRPKAPAGESRPNPALDEAFGAAPEPTRHPSRHNPDITYGNADDRDSDDRHFDKAIRAAQQKVAAIRGKLAELEARKSTAGPSQLPAMAAKIAGLKAEAAAHGENIQKLRGELAASRQRGQAAQAQARRPSGGPIPLEGAGPQAKPAGLHGPAQPLPQRSAATPPPLPHERTQQEASAALNRAAASARSGGPDAARHKAAALQALDAHRRAGFEAIARMAAAKYGNTPKAKVVAMRARAAFTLKLHKAKAKLEAMAGGVRKAWQGGAQCDLSPGLVPPWLVLKRKDASGHDHRGDGKFGTGAGEAPGETHSSASGGTPYSRKPAGYDRKPGQKPGQPSARPAASAQSLERGETGRTPPDPDDRANTLLARIREVPGQMRRQVTSFIRGKYRRLSARYGTKGAVAILGAAVLLTPVPMPGTSLIPIALAEAVLAVKRAIGKGYEAELSEGTTRKEARRLLRDLYAALGEQFSEGSDQ